MKWHLLEGRKLSLKDRTIGPRPNRKLKKNCRKRRALTTATSSSTAATTRRATPVLKQARSSPLLAYDRTHFSDARARARGCVKPASLTQNAVRAAYASTGFTEEEGKTFFGLLQRIFFAIRWCSFFCQWLVFEDCYPKIDSHWNGVQKYDFSFSYVLKMWRCQSEKLCSFWRMFSTQPDK